MDAQDLLLGIIPCSLLPKDSDKLERGFSLEECDPAIHSMGKEKSPGWDGFIVEFFLEFWEPLKGASLMLANRAFLEGQLDPSIIRVLVRLIPKQTSCTLMKHWRPITMMIVLYKIIVKMITQILAPLPNRIVTPHQHGFIKGRSIIDHILAVMVGFEYASFSKQKCVAL